MSNDKSNKSKSEDQLMLDRLNDNKSNVGDSIGISSHERSVTDTESANEDNRFEIMPAADYIKRLKQGDCMSDEY